MFAASKSGRAGPAAPTTDATFGYVPLLLETGSSSSLNTTVTDSSASPNTVTRVSNPSTGWVSPYQTDGYWGNQFNGTNAYLTSTIPALSGQFTIDFWFYRNGTGNNYPFTIGDEGASTGLSILIGSAGTTCLVYSNNAVQITSSTVPTVNAWTYVALTRDASNVVRLYINGTQIVGTWTTSVTFATTIRIAAEFFSGSVIQYSNSYISNFRISNNVRTVTSVPTAPFSQDANTLFLSCQSNRFKDNSSNNATVTPSGTPQVNPYFYPSGFTAPAASPGAVLLNGTNQYLSSPAATGGPFDILTGNFTLEMWIYPTSFNSVQTTLIGTRGALNSNWEVRTTPATSNAIQFYFTATGSSVTSSAAPRLNAWTHVAVVRSTNTVIMYFNGVSVGTATFGSGIGATSTLLIGIETPAVTTDAFPGYIGNLRIVKGTAVYSGTSTTTPNFTPPSGLLTQTGGTYPSLTNVVTGFSAANTSLLLAMSDSNYNSATNGVQNNTFIDESNYAFPITRNGTPTQGSITPYWPNGQWSNYFNGSSYIRSPGFNFSTNNFSIECFLNTASLSAGPQFLGGYDTAGQNYTIAMNAGGVLGYFLSSDGSNWDIASNQTMGTVVANRWHHIVIARTGNKIRSYFDGVGGTVITTSAAIYTNTTNFWLGAAGSAGGNLTGYLSNVRVLNGASAYDANQSAITVPTAPFPTNTTNQVLLTCQGNRFFDANTATTAKTITVTGTPRVQAFQPFSPTASYTTALYGGSGYFNGSTDTLTSSNSTALSWIGLNNGFVECWIYLTVASLSCEIVGKSSISGSSNPNWSFGISSGRLRLLIGSSGSPGTLSVTLTAATTLPLFTWVNVAAARNYVGGASVNVYTLYLNGVIDGGATGASPGDGSPNALFVGREPNAPRWMTGYISNLRFFNASIPSGYQTGSVLTTINSGSVPATGTVAFTPPTAPLTAITGTNLLLNFTNAGIYDAAVQNDIITVGDAQASSAITAQWPPTSIRFDPTTGAATDSLTMLLTPATTITSGDFTIEFWLNPSTVASAYQAIVGTRESDSPASANWGIFLITNQVAFQCYSNASALMVAFAHQTTLSAGTWYYCALTRNGSTFTWYLNGVANTFAPTSAATIGQSGTTLYVGKFGASSTLGALNGYIEDLRITRGVARTITPPPPTAPFPTR